MAFEPKFIRICAKRVRRRSLAPVVGRGRLADDALLGRDRLERLSTSSSTSAMPRLDRDADLAGLDAREVQDVVDQAQQVLAALQICAARCLCRSESGSFRSRAAAARTQVALSGVRSSWLIDDRTRSCTAGSLGGDASFAQLLRQVHVFGQVPIVLTVPPSAVRRSITRDYGRRAGAGRSRSSPPSSAGQRSSRKPRARRRSQTRYRRSRRRALLVRLTDQRSIRPSNGDTRCCRAPGGFDRRPRQTRPGSTRPRSPAGRRRAWPQPPCACAH